MHHFSVFDHNFFTNVYFPTIICSLLEVLSEEAVRMMNQSLADFALGDGRAILSYISTTIDTETATAAPTMKTAICNLTRFKVSRLKINSWKVVVQKEFWLMTFLELLIETGYSGCAT